VSKENFNLVDSILTVKTTGSLSEDIINDLNMPTGKSIAELLNDQKETETETKSEPK